MGRMVADTKLIFNQLSHAAARPDRPAKAKGFGSFEQQRHEERMLFGTQQRGCTGGGMGAQRRDPLRGGPPDPLADRPLRDAQGLGDLLLGPAVLMQFPGAEAATFGPTQRWVRVCRAHKRRAEQIPTHEY